MALSVDYLYNFALKLIRKNQSGSISGTEFQYFWNDSQDGYLGDLLGRFQMQGVGKSGINTGLILNETILTKIAPFTKNETLVVSNGSSDRPSGLLYRLALRINGYDCSFINHGQIASVNHSVIDPPSTSTNTYYAISYEDYYSFLPNTITEAQIDYVVYPNRIVWGYVYNSDGQQVYDSSTSVQSQWDDISNMEITKRMLENMGISLKDKDFQSFGTKTELTGV